jgi:hypothetical protein
MAPLRGQPERDRGVPTLREESDVMGQVYARGAKPLPVISRWDITQWNIVRLEIELGLRDEWPDDVPKRRPIHCPPRIEKR